MMHFINCQRNKILAVAGILIAVVLIAVFGILMAVTWSDLKQANYPTTSTFISSSSAVKLGCYSKNTLKSVEINKTSSTNVYSSDESSNEALIMTKKLDETEPLMFTNYPSKFQVYYDRSHYNKPLYSVKNGNIIYKFTVQNTEIAENCTLKIYVFVSYFKFSKYLTTPEEVKSINETCLTTSKMEDVFVINFTLPAQQYTYIAGIANSGVVENMTYFAIGGTVTTYDTSQLNNETQCNNNNDNSCSITFGGHMGKKCVFVSQVLENGLGENYNYIQAEFTKVKATPTTDSLTVVFSITLSLSILLGALALIYNKRKTRFSEANTSPAEHESADGASERDPLVLPNGGAGHGASGTVHVPPFTAIPSTQSTNHVQAVTEEGTGAHNVISTTSKIYQNDEQNIMSAGP